ncbi:MAG: phage tail protein [Desulfosoma sp.]
MASHPGYPLPVFRFRVDFFTSASDADGGGEPVPLCSGRFAECSGLDASMEPKVIKEGGRNYGAVHRAGRVSFGTVILRRGITSSRDLWRWFELVAKGGYAFRLDVVITLLDMGMDPESHEGALRWRLRRALPVKFRAPDFNARAADVGIEEVHFVHEGLEREGS